MTLATLFFIRGLGAGTSILSYGAHSITETGFESFDSTVAIQKALDSADVVDIPKGIYLVDPSVGLVLKRDHQIISGTEWGQSVLRTRPLPGSVFRRAFTADAPNPRISYVMIQNIGIELHRAPDPGLQIGFDFRNISRSLITNCYVGNMPIAEVTGQSSEPKPNLITGIGIAFGTVPSSSPAYCGGEVNQVLDTTIIGVRKAISIDDEELSPRSGAHATRIVHCDIQTVESGISQESKYGAANMFRDNLIQDIIAQPGSRHKTYAYRIEGMNSLIEGGYLEEKADYAIYFGEASRSNTVGSLYVANPGAQRQVDHGTGNQITQK